MFVMCLASMNLVLNFYIFDAMTTRQRSDDMRRHKDGNATATTARSGQRISTLIVRLNEVIEGGEAVTKWMRSGEARLLRA
jgi:hypothetical protein